MMMPFSENTPGQMSETMIGPYEEIRSRCINEVHTSVGELRDQLIAGQPIEQDTFFLGRTILDITKEAAKSNDLDQIETHIDTLARLGKGVGPSFVSACYIGTRMGSQQAFELLQGILKAEKLQAEQSVARQKEESPYLLRPFVSQYCLDKIISACEESGVPPNVWIDKYALDEEYRWLLYVKHYSGQAMETNSETIEDHKQLDLKITELLDMNTFPVGFVMTQIPAVLRRTKDPELRKRLARHFMGHLSETPLTNETFLTLTTMGTILLQDSNLADRATIDNLALSIPACASQLKDAGTDTFWLTRVQLSWEMELKRHFDATPDEIISHLDIQIGHLLNSNIPDQAEGLTNMDRNRASVDQLRNAYLSSYAKHYAAEGDFRAAHLFLSRMTDLLDMGSTFDDCLAKARTTEEIAQITPDEMTLALSPDLTKQLKAAEVRLAGNQEELEQLSLQAAATIMNPEENKYLKLELIKNTYGIAAAKDPERAIGFAKNLLALLREAEQPYYHLQYLSEAVILAGDSDEPKRAYDYISQTSRDTFRKLDAIWRLAKLLASKS